MYRKSFYKYLETQQNPEDLVYIYGLQKKKLTQRIQTQKTEDLFVQEAAAAIVKQVKQSLEI